MLFDEYYGSYFRAVAAILRKAIEGPVTRRDMAELCQRYSFGDAFFNIPDALLQGKWPLLSQEGEAIVDEVPMHPLTLLEKQWLKGVSLDPRIQLFDVDLSFLGDVELLFRPEDIICYDCYNDGDDYGDPVYQANFRVLRRAAEEKREVLVTYRSRREKTTSARVTPLRLEYSEKDDRFRVLCARGNEVKVYNLSGIVSCEPGEIHRDPLPDPDARDSRYVVLEIRDLRNAMERVSMHFTHLRKEVERTGQRTFRMKLWYDPMDEPEMIIRMLQFGPYVRVVEPETLRKEVVRRVEEQMRLLGVKTGDPQ